MSRNKKILSVIIIASVILLAFVAPQAVNRVTGLLPERVASWLQVPVVPFTLGLDLIGGVDLLYEADLTGVPESEQADAMEGIRDVVERRINYFGVAEPVVAVVGDNQLSVQIAGISDVDAAIQLIGGTPYLEFREEGQELSEDGKPIISASIVDGKLVRDEYSGWKSTGLTGKQLERASIAFDPQTGQPQVSLILNEEGAKLFAEITRRNLGKPVAIFLDGYPISVPTVQSEISDGQAVITGQFTPAEARQLATRLNSGALPVPITLVSQRAVGPTLGAQSLDASLTAGLWSLAFVAVFMVVLYRLPGFSSLLALGVYLLAVLAVYKVLPVTLTLAGISGFILSLGMALDANVLIFARMREEIAAGRPLTGAMSEGFRRSWPSIRDSHVTMLIAAIVLWVFTASLVKGFALTLGIGVILSLLTSIVVTRAILTSFISGRLAKRPRLFA